MTQQSFGGGMDDSSYEVNFVLGEKIRHILVVISNLGWQYRVFSGFQENELSCFTFSPCMLNSCHPYRINEWLLKCSGNNMIRSHVKNQPRMTTIANRRYYVHRFNLIFTLFRLLRIFRISQNRNLRNNQHIKIIDQIRILSVTAGTRLDVICSPHAQNSW